jgi:lipoprotein-releasing system permease protein
MYKLLLCLRYLRTRYIALASIVSVTLGVATMIVVNAVMAGFVIEMQERIKGILSDISFEARSLTGFRDPAEHMRRINEVAGEHIEWMTATVHVPAMLSIDVNGETITKPVQLIGGDAKTIGRATKFAEYLQHPRHRQGDFDFRLREGGYDTRDHQAGTDARVRKGMEIAGWELRRRRAAWMKKIQALERSANQDAGGAGSGGLRPPLASQPVPEKVQLTAKLPPGLSIEQRRAMQTALQEILGSSDQVPGQVVVNADGSIDVVAKPAAAPGKFKDPFEARGPENENVFDAAKEQHTGCVLGIALSNYRPRDGAREERFLVLPGDDVQITFPTAGTPPKAVSDTFTVVDFYESKMSEYDNSFVFVPVDKLQEMRGMIDPSSGQRFITSIQIKLKDESKGDLVRDLLRDAFPVELYNVQTWRDKQGPLLAAVHMETLILNVLLFLIIAVAGFGILAIFFMIVVEKTKDIGILKSLGASSSGVAGIFLAYGLSLGVVGSGAGLAGGLLLVRYINEIAKVLGKITGHEVFDPEIYYFYEIPTRVDPVTIGSIMLGALAIAVCASVMPALRAARFHPVEALRHG